MAGLTPQPGLLVIETFRMTASGSVPRIDRHLDRMAQTANRLGYAFDRQAAVAALPAAGPADLRVRLTLDIGGRFAATAAPLDHTAPLWRVVIAEERITAADPWLAVKTTRRERYDRVRTCLPRGVDEALFLNETGEVCEGAITNVFVQRGERLLTPPRAAGLLPGILRQELLTMGRAVEAPLRREDLTGAEGIYVGNALRGLIRAELARA